MGGVPVIRRWFARRNAEADRRILEALWANTEVWHNGYALMRSTRMYSGRVYPALDRLVAAGRVERRWDDLPTPGKGRRRLYRLARVQPCVSPLLNPPKDPA